MKLVDKILFIQKSMGLTDREFSSKFKIKYGTFKKWLSNSAKPTNNNVLVLCKEFSLDPNDFIDDSSTLDKDNIKEGEHLCKFLSGDEKPNVIFEDFAREDNSRYEEKD